jgi:adenylate cyclase
MVFPTAVRAADAAIAIVGSVGARDLPPARAGLALGRLVARAGDYFGVPVNLASRLVERADPGAVWVDAAFRADLGAAYATQRLELQELKGIGAVQPWRIGKSG